MTERTTRSGSRRHAPPPRRGSRVAIGVLIAVVAVLVLAVVAEAALTFGRVHPGVSVGGVNVGGQTKARAQATIERELNARMATAPIVLVAGERKWKTNAESLQASVDSQALTEQAMAVGRQGNLVQVAQDRLGAWMNPVEIAAGATVDQKRLEKFLGDVNRAIAVAPKDADTRMKSGKPVVVAAKPGVELDTLKAAAAVELALLATSRTIQVPTKVAEPSISDEEAKAAQQRALAFLGGPAKVVGEEKSWTFAPAKIAPWIGFRLVGQDATKTIEAYIDEELLTEATKGQFGSYLTPPKDATFQVDNGKVVISPSKDGVGPDMHALAAQLTTSLAEATGPRSASLRIGRVKPELTTDEAKSYGIKQRLGVFTTTYDPSNKPRVNNIHLLAKSLNGKLLAPGETFSFNGTIGQRTAAKGYQEANAIVAGKLVPQLGGGICQVCTTLFNAVFFSGLPVEQRVNHYFYIDHYPPGRDATVSWGGPDFKFTNDTKNWVLVATSTTPSSVTVALYGTNPGYKVSFTTGAFTDFTPFKTDETKDPNMPLGARFVEEGGIRGRSVVVERTVKQNGAVVRTDRFVSDYKPKSEIVRVGTKKPAPSKTPTPTPTPSP